MEKRGFRPSGFTLVEWLVVLGVLALLCIILFPAGHGDHEHARGAQCCNNQRQIVLAALVWAQDNDEKTPPTNTVWSVLKLTQVPSIPTVAASTPSFTIMRCPDAMSLANGYVYNSSIAGKDLAKITGVSSAIFLTADGQHTAADGKSRNVAFTMADLDTGRHAPMEGVWPFKHKGAPRFIASFLDGHIDLLTPADAKGWLPG